MSELQRRPLFDAGFSAKMHERIEARSRIALAEFAQNGWKLSYNDGFAGISIQELKRVGYKIADCKNIWQVYDILGEESSIGLCYYDVVIRPQHLRAYDKMNKILEKLEPSRVERGIDLGTGTGEMALVLGKRCEHITAIDITPSLLKVAKKKLLTAKKRGNLGDFDIKIMDVLNLNLPEESVDIVIGNGLQSYLTNEELLVMMEQVRRVLKKGGRYYEYQADNPDPPEYKTSQRAYLVGEIVSAIVGHTFTRQNVENQKKLKVPGFDLTALNIVDNITPRGYKEVLLKFTKK